MLADNDTEALISSSIVLTRDSPTAASPCPGFSVDALANPTGPTTIETTVAATNSSTSSARVTVQISVAGKDSYIPLGIITSGQTTQKSVSVSVPRGASVLRARLLVGG